MSSDRDSQNSGPTASSQIFPLAHPPPKPPQCLRLTPRLVLQIQQLAASSGRAVPVLDVLRPSRLGKALALGNARMKLPSRGLYLAQSEPFLHLGASARAASDVVAAISSLSLSPSPRGGPSTDVLYFAPASSEAASVPDSWEVQRTPRGYRFQQTTTEGGHGLVLEWEKRPRAEEEKGDRFVLSIDAAAAAAEDLRRPWLATLTKKGLKVPRWDRGQRAHLARDDETLYTWVLTMGVYVAAQEGWIHV